MIKNNILGYYYKIIILKDMYYMYLYTFSTSSLNPIFNISSASSRTMAFKSWNRTTPLLSISNNLPGVATKISHPALNS